MKTSKIKTTCVQPFPMTFAQKRAIVRLKNRWERWPDNVAPMLFGGGAIVASYSYESGAALHHAIETDGYCHT